MNSPYLIFHSISSDSSGLQQWFDSTSGACGEQTVEACAGVPVCDVYDGNCHDAEDFFVTPTPEPFFKACYMLKSNLIIYLRQFIILEVP